MLCVNTALFALLAPHELLLPLPPPSANAPRTNEWRSSHDILVSKPGVCCSWKSYLSLNPSCCTVRPSCIICAVCEKCLLVVEVVKKKKILLCLPFYKEDVLLAFIR